MIRLQANETVVAEWTFNKGQNKFSASPQVHPNINLYESTGIVLTAPVL